MKNWNLKIFIIVTVHFLCAEMLIELAWVPIIGIDDIFIPLQESEFLTICYRIFLYLISAFTLWELVMKNIDTPKHKKWKLVVVTLLVSAAAIFFMCIIAIFVNMLIFCLTVDEICSTH